LARVCQLITQAAGIKKDPDTKEGYSLIDFMPHEDGYAESQEEIDFETFMMAQEDYIQQDPDKGDL
jgi:hypothetical protein